MSDMYADLQSDISRLRKLNASLAAYREISEMLLNATTMEEIAGTAGKILQDLFQAEGSAMILPSDSAAPPDLLQQYGSPGEAWLSVPEATRCGLVESVRRRAQTLADADVASLLAREGLPAAPLLKSILMMPLRTGPQDLGVLIIHNFIHPEHLPRYARDATALIPPIARAITRVRLMEAYAQEARLLETILENTTGQVAYLDKGFNFVQVNSAYVQGCGHSREDLISRNHFRLFPNAENEAIFERVRDTAEPVEYVEKPFEYADQPERGVTYWNWRLTPVKKEGGEVEGLVLSLTDMTEHVRTRERLLAAQKARADLAEAMAQEVNHRMKNNLTIVAGLLQMQADTQPGNSPGATMLREAIARIRTFSAVHEQMHEAQVDSVELLDAIRRVADIDQETLSPGDVEVSVEGEQMSYPSQVAAGICVVVNELITNAIKHGAPGPADKLQIKITVALQESSLRLSVWNSGNPIRPDFEPSRQTTVGLPLVFGIVADQYGGSFTIRPHGGGSLAQIVLEDGRLRGEE